MMKSMIYSLLLPVIFKVQVATSQQVLVVELSQFRNVYNAEVINGQYCCCDKNEKCALKPQYPANCKSKCDTWFNITISPCKSSYSCSTATVAHCNSASVNNLDYKFEFLMRNSSETNVTLTINAWDRQKCYDQEIDAISRSFPLLATDERQEFRDYGDNGIGVFTFSYHVQNVFNETEVHVCITEVLPPVDNSTCESAIDESASTWPWMAVAILFMLLTTSLFIGSIVLACIVRRQLNDAGKGVNNEHGSSRRCTSGSPSSADDQHLPNACSSSYKEESLIKDQYSGSMAKQMQANAYDVPMPLLMFDGGMDERP